LQAIAQTGLTFCRDPYDCERYEVIRQLAARMFAARTDAPLERIEALFAGETGYPTPKVDVRVAVFDDEDRILMVRGTSDDGRWTLPGGWADVTGPRRKTPPRKRSKSTAARSLAATQILSPAMRSAI
jgi:Hydrolase of X-linked nucleoside diphosphate N terminal